MTAWILGFFMTITSATAMMPAVLGRYVRNRMAKKARGEAHSKKIILID